jgi:hypothetical protein
MMQGSAVSNEAARIGSEAFFEPEMLIDPEGGAAVNDEFVH